MSTLTPWGASCFVGQLKGSLKGPLAIWDALNDFFHTLPTEGLKVARKGPTLDPKVAMIAPKEAGLAR